MILKNFEKLKVVIFFSILLILFEIFLYCFFLSIKINTYHKYSGIIFSNKLVYLMVNDNELNDIYKNKAFIYDKNKYKLDIDHINRNVLKRDGKNINQVFIKYKSVNRDNEVIDIILYNKKINVIEMFKIIWKEDV